MTDAVNETALEAERQRQMKRNIRLTGAALWLTAASIFAYMLVKYYWIAK